MHLTDIQEQLERAVRRVLSEQNRDIHAPAYGCMDRRFWAWKLVDFPEATFQRNVLLLLWKLARANGPERAVLVEAIVAGVNYAVAIQHSDGSWDQAFPHEHSFGATAFLLHPLLTAYETTKHEFSEQQQSIVEAGLARAADFLTQHNEEHGHIANHLAGAALSLLVASRFFKAESYAARAEEIVASVLKHASAEGWFLEYDGADPGYQSLCLYYLAQIQQIRPTNELKAALDRAVEFLSWFVHPDGTFAGEYGSRRTAVFYPGGIALLAKTNALAADMIDAMVTAIQQGDTVRLDQIDVGNLAPMASNYALLAEADGIHGSANGLPFNRQNAAANFPQAGLFVRTSNRYYAIIGASNGGVVKVFDRASKTLLINDGGYLGETDDGSYVTTQVARERKVEAAEKEVGIEVAFRVMNRALPSPSNFLALRALNLTAMRSVEVGNFIKQKMVALMIRGGSTYPLELRRRVRIDGDRVSIMDEVVAKKRIRLKWLQYGQPFVAIHMASSRYYENAASAQTAFPPRQIDVRQLAKEGKVHAEIRL